jgi:hypothetical protein
MEQVLCILHAKGNYLQKEKDIHVTLVVFHHLLRQCSLSDPAQSSLTSAQETDCRDYCCNA